MNLNEKLILSEKHFVYLISHANIAFCESDNCYTTIYLIDGKRHLAVRSLAKLSNEDLNVPDFIRVNQSFLINRNHINTIDKKKKIIKMTGDYEIPFTISLKSLFDHIKMTCAKPTT
jgi:two-component system LytT family response regulator